MTVRSVIRKGINISLNNIIFNRIWVFMRLDNLFIRYFHIYNIYKYKQGISQQEINGFSQVPEINSLLAWQHDNLQQVAQTYVKGNNVMDIGCGTGLYLKDFSDSYNLTGVDMRKDILLFAEEYLPNAEFYCGDFMKIQPDKKFNLIYCIGMLAHIPPSNIASFFYKVNSLLQPSGVFYLSYAHAIKFSDLFYPDLTYIQYSPVVIEKIAKQEFEIIKHGRSQDENNIRYFDNKPFFNSVNIKYKTYRNSSVIILRKKDIEK